GGLNSKANLAGAAADKQRQGASRNSAEGGSNKAPAAVTKVAPIPCGRATIVSKDVESTQFPLFPDPSGRGPAIGLFPPPPQNASTNRKRRPSTDVEVLQSGPDAVAAATAAAEAISCMDGVTIQSTMDALEQAGLQADAISSLLPPQLQYNPAAIEELRRLMQQQQEEKQGHNREQQGQQEQNV
ncbi:hypothetical protein BGZ95_006773, partial [Linnemannia exigua]